MSSQSETKALDEKGWKEHLPYTVMEYRNMSSQTRRLGNKGRTGASYYHLNDPQAKYNHGRSIFSNPTDR